MWFSMWEVYRSGSYKNMNIIVTLFVHKLSKLHGDNNLNWTPLVTRTSALCSARMQHELIQIEKLRAQSNDRWGAVRSLSMPTSASGSLRLSEQFVLVLLHFLNQLLAPG
jgi:hypothetical protein